VCAGQVGVQKDPFVSFIPHQYPNQTKATPNKREGRVFLNSTASQADSARLIVFEPSVSIVT
jgi:hypothetical protein